MPLTDIQIALKANKKDIKEIAQQVHLTEDEIDYYGKDKGKIDLAVLSKKPSHSPKLVLVTAMSPTAAGEGKTTTTIGLADSLQAIGKKAILALREPSLGPVFGMKGGATGGGYAQVIPMEEINLHFTGDFHAITSANNLLAALIDNHIYHGNQLGIDPQRIIWKRCLDMNDRQLRYIIDGINNRVERNDGFDITVASEMMAIFCLAKDVADLKHRLENIIIGYNYDNQPVTAKDLEAVGAIMVLLKQAIKPNLVQTLENTPAIIHGGPFANIAHGCNSLIATKTAMNLAEYTITEAGFGADLGAEKFLDIKCRIGGLKPDAVVVVATIRALKMHGGVSKENLNDENVEALLAGLPNLLRHVDNIRHQFQLPCVVAINRFTSDTEAEIGALLDVCAKHDIKAVLNDVWAQGSKGGLALAQQVVELCEAENNFRYVYDLEDDLEVKIEKVVQRIYGGSRVSYSEQALKQLQEIKELGYNQVPICVAKTQYSFSDDPKLLSAPSDFELHVAQLKVSAGAGFVVVYTGTILTMPGLPKVPAANHMGIDEAGTTFGLF